MGKKRSASSSSADAESSPRKKSKHEEKDKVKEKDKDKKDKKDKDEKKDKKDKKEKGKEKTKEKEKSKDKDKEKEDKAKHKDKDEQKDEKAKDKAKHKEDKAKEDTPKKDKGKHEKQEKKDKSEKKDKDAKASFLAGMGMKEVSFEADVPFHDEKRPFGIELDGSLVVDLAMPGDEDTAAMAAGVQIGWRISSVAGTDVTDEEGAAAKQLRSAETDAAKKKESVSVRFVTEEPDHWKKASGRLAVKKGR